MDETAYQDRQCDPHDEVDDDVNHHEKLYSISSTFYKQLLHWSPFAKKVKETNYPPANRANELSKIL
jgi:hypothetical protein